MAHPNYLSITIYAYTSIFCMVNDFLKSVYFKLCRAVVLLFFIFYSHKTTTLRFGLFRWLPDTGFNICIDFKPFL